MAILPAINTAETDIVTKTNNKGVCGVRGRRLRRNFNNNKQKGKVAMVHRNVKENLLIYVSKVISEARVGADILERRERSAAAVAYRSAQKLAQVKMEI